MYRIDNWINEGSGWIVELIESQYINILTYRPLSGSSYIKLPIELKGPKKRLIRDQKGFYGVILDILIQSKYIQKELHGEIENLLIILIKMELKLLREKKILARLKKRPIVLLTCFVMKTN